ncbi:hypothetical protein FB451DRAFT_1181415 [Mycena latifolia]|nr:hypothetical protein FB451DRAFT_1181415 [Mycena latifolia]
MANVGGKSCCDDAPTSCLPRSTSVYLCVSLTTAVDIESANSVLLKMVLGSSLPKQLGWFTYCSALDTRGLGVVNLLCREKAAPGLKLFNARPDEFRVTESNAEEKKQNHGRLECLEIFLFLENQDIGKLRQHPQGMRENRVDGSREWCGVVEGFLWHIVTAKHVSGTVCIPEYTPAWFTIHPNFKFAGWIYIGTLQ